MSDNLIVDVLLGIAVGAEFVCVAGFVAARSVFDRLHFVAAASTVPPVLILVALIVREGLPGNIMDAIVVVVLLLLANPVAVHALGRAARLVEFGTVKPAAGEELDQVAPGPRVQRRNH